jgi:hypothetical protein
MPLCLNDVGKNVDLKPRDQARPTNMLSIEPTAIEFKKMCNTQDTCLKRYWRRRSVMPCDTMDPTTQPISGFQSCHC